jgi:hypothetical protein
MSAESVLNQITTLTPCKKSVVGVLKDTPTTLFESVLTTLLQHFRYTFALGVK